MQFNPRVLDNDEDENLSELPDLGFDVNNEIFAGEVDDGFAFVINDEDEMVPADLVVLEEKKLKAIETSKKQLLVDNNKAYQIINDAGIQSLNANTYNEELEKTKLQLTRDTPFFLTEDMAATVRKNIDKVDGLSKESSLKLLTTLMPYQDITGFHLDIFHSYIKKVKNAGYARTYDIIERNSKNKSQVLALVQDLLSEQAPALPQNLVDFNKSDVVFLEEGELSLDGITFVCSKCGARTTFKGILLSILNKEKFTPIVTPLKCGSCGQYHILPKDNVKALMRDLKDTKLKALSDNSSTSINLYVPSITDIIKAFPDILTFKSSYKEDEFTIDVDWDALEKEFITSENIYYCKSLVSGSEGIGYHNLAKIVGNRGGCYSVLKENALASLIICLQESPCSQFKESILFTDELLASYQGHDEFNSQLASKLDLNADEFKNEFKSFCNFVESRHQDRDKLVQDLYDNRFILSNLPIIDYYLQDEDIMEYLTYEPLRKVLEEIADLMILSNKSEELLQSLKPVKFKDNAFITRDASYDTRFRKLEKVRKQDHLEQDLLKYLDFFNNCKMSESFTPNIQDFFAFHCIDYSFISIVVRFAKALLSGDYYSAQVIKISLNDNYKKILKSLEKSPRYRVISRIINDMPPVDVSLTRFEYYFPNETNLTKEQQQSILDIQSRRKITPSYLKGDTFEEKYNYYNTFSVTRSLKVFKDEALFDFVNSNLAAIIALSCLDANLHFQNLTIYLVSRDFLLCLSDYTLDTVSNCLGIDKDICSTFLNDSEFNYAPVELDYSKFLQYVCFKSSVFSDLLNSTLVDGDLQNEIESSANLMLEELAGLELPTRVLKSYLTKKV